MDGNEAIANRFTEQPSPDDVAAALRRWVKAAEEGELIFGMCPHRALDELLALPRDESPPEPAAEGERASEVEDLAAQAVHDGRHRPETGDGCARVGLATFGRLRDAVDAWESSGERAEPEPPRGGAVGEAREAWHKACGVYFGNPTQENHDIAERAWEDLLRAEAAGEADHD